MVSPLRSQYVVCGRCGLRCQRSQVLQNYVLHELELRGSSLIQWWRWTQVGTWDLNRFTMFLGFSCLESSCHLIGGMEHLFEQVPSATVSYFSSRRIIHTPQDRLLVFCAVCLLLQPITSVCSKFRTTAGENKPLSTMLSTDITTASRSSSMPCPTSTNLSFPAIFLRF
jgi:hypothetical protein